MGQGDYMPTGGHQRKHDPVHAKQIKEGGIRAQLIHKTSVAKHQEEDIPQAEDELMKELETIDTQHLDQAKK